MGTAKKQIIKGFNVSNLNTVGDVNSLTPTDGQYLVWDGTAGKWVNRDGTVTLENWSTSTNYTLGQYVTHDNLHYLSKEAHNSSATDFYDDLGKWQITSTHALISNQVAHGLSKYTPVYLNDATGNWTLAQSNSADKLATHIVLETATDYLLLVDEGTFTFTSHGLSIGVHYVTPTGTPLTQTTRPTVDYVNEVLEVLDSDTFTVTSNKSAELAGNAPLYSGYVLVAKLEYDNEQYNTDIAYDGSTLPHLFIEASGKYSLTSDTNSQMFIRLNGDNGNNYRYSDHWSGTGHSYQYNSSMNMWYVGSFGKICGLTRISADLASGKERPFMANWTYSRSATGYNRQTGGTWLNTADEVSFLNIYTDNNFTGTVYVYGRSA